MATTEKIDSRDRADAFMRERLDRSRLMWEMRGPKDTMIEWLQCWLILSTGRMILIECYKDGNGFDVFPQVLVNGLCDTAKVVEEMTKLEKPA